MEKILRKTRGAATKAEEMIISLTRDILHAQALGGMLLAFSAIMALIFANSPLYPFYSYIFEGLKFRIEFSDVQSSFQTEIDKSLLYWINDGLMALFFFTIGLEIKRELLEGRFSKCECTILPTIAAIGGMAVPALIFWLINHETPENLSGWAIPTATDIVFALAVLSMLGKRVPASLKLLLLMIAVADDIGAILIIAVFYSHDIHVEALYIACAALAILILLNRKGISSVGPYALTGFLLWATVVESGIHATIAGVAAALFVPLHGKSDSQYSPLKHLEHDLYPAVTFVVLPLFAFANAGIPLGGVGRDDLFDPVTVGIVLGLFLGKPLGVFTMLWLTIRTGLCPKPEGTNWIQLFSMSTLCGIGFTMSLFIGVLSYDDLAMQTSVRVGVMAGSILSAITGFMLLYWNTKANRKIDHVKSHKKLSV